MKRYRLQHLDLSQLARSRPYKSGATGRRERINRIREKHGPLLVEDYERAFDEAVRRRTGSATVLEPLQEFILEVELSSRTGPANLTRKKEKTRQGAVRIQPDGAQRVVLAVPDSKRDVLGKIFREYTEGDLKGSEGGTMRPPNAARVEEIERIRSATFESFWRDDPTCIPQDPEQMIWWALWCFQDRVDNVIEAASSIGCRVSENDSHLYFPDIQVVPVYGSKLAVEILLFGTVGIAELRRATDSPTFFTDEIKGDEYPWMDDYLERIHWPSGSSPAVCILDSGVNRAHPLLEPAMMKGSVDSVKKAWGSDDHLGHGTLLAGISLHGDLTAALADAGTRKLEHRAESVKVLPPKGFAANSPNAYGSISQAAVSLAEINDPSVRFRVYCHAITNQDRSGAQASAWSAAIDQAASGAMKGDIPRGRSKRLFVTTVGNIQDYEAKRALSSRDAFPAEDPAQAWNAIAVGGYTDKTQIQDRGYEQYSPLVGPGELSPYSRTSNLWREVKSPFKPDLLFEAGNRARSNTGDDIASSLPSLSLLTTGFDVIRSPLDVACATSAAAAQCSRMAARIAAALPHYWPETVRALMIHSADWTDPMLAEFGRSASLSDRIDLLRRFGYGVPNIDRALKSARNDLALVSQQSIQPYRKDRSGIKFNEAHLYELPWPSTVLQALGNVRVRLKVTLSYFVEPNPGYSSAIDPMRYQSYGLRFDLKRAQETPRTFLKRRNFGERKRDEKLPPFARDRGWLIGERAISSGSLHCDIWEGPAVDLASRNLLWIYPVSGWWRERKSLARFNDSARYALILTLISDDQSIDIYTEICNILVQLEAEVQPMLSHEVST